MRVGKGTWKQRALCVLCCVALATSWCLAPLSEALAASGRIGKDEVQETEQEGSFDATSGEEVVYDASAGAGSSRRVPAEGDQSSWRYGGEEADPTVVVPRPTWSAANGLSSYSYEEGGVSCTVEVGGVQSLGIDVSEHQGVIDWLQVADSGVTFALIRCGFGDADCPNDGQWLANVAGAQEAGIAIGVYLYSYAASVEEASSEADHALQALADAGLSSQDVSLPVFYDLEENSLANAASSSLLGEMATVFCGKLQAAGYNVGIYANVDWWQNYLTDPAFDNPSWHRWVAGYYCGQSSVAGLVPGAEMWQFCSRGSVSGIAGNVDMSFCFVDWAEVLRAESVGLPTITVESCTVGPGWVTVRGWCTGVAESVAAETLRLGVSCRSGSGCGAVEMSLADDMAAGNGTGRGCGFAVTILMPDARDACVEVYVRSTDTQVATVRLARTARQSSDGIGSMLYYGKLTGGMVPRGWYLCLLTTAK